MNVTRYVINIGVFLLIKKQILYCSERIVGVTKLLKSRREPVARKAFSDLPKNLFDADCFGGRFSFDIKYLCS